MSMEPEELDASLQRVGDARIVALDQPWDVNESDGLETTLLETLPDRGAVDPAAIVKYRNIGGPACCC